MKTDTTYLSDTAHHAIRAIEAQLDGLSAFWRAPFGILYDNSPRAREERLCAMASIRSGHAIIREIVEREED